MLEAFASAHFLSCPYASLLVDKSVTLVERGQH